MKNPALSSPRYFKVVCDSSFKNGEAGVGILISKGERLYAPRTKCFKAEGPQHAELLGIVVALKEVLRLSGEKKVVLVVCDSEFAIGVCRGLVKACRWYVIEARRQILQLTPMFHAVFFSSMKSEDAKKVDRLSKKARKVRESKIQERIEARVSELLSTLEKAKRIVVIHDEVGYYALSEKASGKKYRVSLDPPSCECPWFTERWRRVPDVGVYLHRMPCKHICALALKVDRRTELYRYV